MDKTIAIIGAGEAAIPIVNKAKEMGIRTLCFGQSNSLAKDIPDIFVDCSIFDVDRIIKECKKNKVDGVMASSEITTEIAAIVANKLNLPGNDITDGFSGRNKFVMREKVKKIKTVKQPKYSMYNESKNIEFPVIVKSVDSCGKRGISLAKNKDQLEEAISYAEKFATNGAVLIEEYIEGGREFSIECISNGNEHCIIQITEKESSGEPHFVEIAHHQPAQIDDGLKEKIFIGVKDILNVLGIKCGMSHLELKEKNGELYFIEVGARAGGDHIGDKLVSLSTDCDYFKDAIECSLGIYKIKKVNNVACSGIYFYCNANIDKYPLFQVAKNSSWCHEYKIESNKLIDVKSNIEASNAGYIIYKSDHKIILDDALNSFVAEIVNKRTDAYQLVWNYSKNIGRNISDDELDKGIRKFINQGNIISVLNDNRIIAMLNLYCNNYETREAYICNVEVINEYRGYGISKKLIEKAIEFTKKEKFKKILLHVDKGNYKAVSLYKKYGFKFTGNKINKGELLYEMILLL